MKTMLLSLAVLVAGTSTAKAADAPEAAQKIFQKLLTAVQDNDIKAFVADATDAVKEGTTKKIMEALHKSFGSRLKKGYKASYLCELNQAEHHVYLWKLTFSEGDNVIVRIALKDGKVGGFFLQ